MRKTLGSVPSKAEAGCADINLSPPLPRRWRIRNSKSAWAIGDPALKSKRKQTNKEEGPQSHLRDSTHCADRRTRIRAGGAVRPRCCNPRDVYGSLPASRAKNMANSSSARLKRMKAETAYRKGHLQCPSMMCAHAFPPHLHTPSGIAHSEPNTTTVCGAWLRAGALGWSPPVVAVRWIS